MVDAARPRVLDDAAVRVEEADAVEPTHSRAGRRENDVRAPVGSAVVAPAQDAVAGLVLEAADDDGVRVEGVAIRIVVQWLPPSTVLSTTPSSPAAKPTWLVPIEIARR